LSDWPNGRSLEEPNISDRDIEQSSSSLSRRRTPAAGSPQSCASLRLTLSIK
jgi:hypothetical protein